MQYTTANTGKQGKSTIYEEIATQSEFRAAIAAELQLKGEDMTEAAMAQAREVGRG